MGATIFCFVTPDHNIDVDSTGHKDLRLEYVFDLENRQMYFVGRPGSAFMRELRHDAVARNYFDALVGTPEKLIEFARKGQLNKASLASLLDPRIRETFLSICAIVEKEDTDSFEICVDIWVSKFQHPENRLEIWRN